jgi:thioredoxin reductase
MRVPVRGYRRAMDDAVDALVVGAGPAGLSAALWLARHRCRTLVADRGEPRNRWVDASYGYLGFDGEAPEALLRAGRQELQRYPEVEFAPVGVRSLHHLDGGFEAELDGRRLRAAAVIVATGVVDAVPPLAGLREHYGKQVFVCPLCDGYEVRGGRVVVLGAGGQVDAFATELLRWASEVTVVPLIGERPPEAVAPPATHATSPARAVIGDARGITGVELTDGRRVDCEVIFLRSEITPVTDLAIHLGCRCNDEGLLEVDAEGRTSIECVYAAGDCTPGPQLVQIAAAEGARAGLHCARRLMAQR